MQLVPVVQQAPSGYRNPGQLPKGGVLVVGASASGIQLADEIHASGRPVTLAVGRHTRMPRRYRGRDILWWIDTMGGFMAQGIDRNGQERAIDNHCRDHPPSAKGQVNQIARRRKQHQPADKPDQTRPVAALPQLLDGFAIQFHP